MKKSIIVIGAGKGLGNGVAEKFGMNGFKVVLMARRRDKLEEYKKNFEAKGIETYIHQTDVSDFDKFAKDYNEITNEYGTPDVLFYNVGITTADADTKINIQTFFDRYRVDVVGAYNAVKTADTEEFSKKNGCILITGGGLSLQPYAEYLPLSMDKAALRAMVHALAPVYKEKGIYIGTVQVTGAIGSNEHFSPKAIAEEFWKLYINKNNIEVIY